MDLQEADDSGGTARLALVAALKDGAGELGLAGLQERLLALRAIVVLRK